MYSNRCRILNLKSKPWLAATNPAGIITLKQTIVPGSDRACDKMAEPTSYLECWTRVRYEKSRESGPEVVASASFGLGKCKCISISECGDSNPTDHRQLILRLLLQESWPIVCGGDGYLGWEAPSLLANLRFRAFICPSWSLKELPPVF